MLRKKNSIIIGRTRINDKETLIGKASTLRAIGQADSFFFQSMVSESERAEHKQY